MIHTVQQRVSEIRIAWSVREFQLGVLVGMLFTCVASALVLGVLDLLGRG